MLRGGPADAIVLAPPADGMPFAKVPDPRPARLQRRNDETVRATWAGLPAGARGRLGPAVRSLKQLLLPLTRSTPPNWPPSPGACAVPWATRRPRSSRNSGAASRCSTSLPTCRRRLDRAGADLLSGPGAG
jgi:hypothetical protein